jgi:hypothetical protein
MEHVGPAFFAAADANSAFHGNTEVLDAAFRDMMLWPLPRFAQEFELPLLGHVLMFRAPPVRGIAHILDAEHNALAAFACASPVSNLDSINVYESFCTIVPHLWLLWELVLTGAPVLVYATNAGHASDAVYAALSLIAPLEYGGEVQPFFTVQDDTFAAFSRATKGGPLPTALIGTSNPFFFTAFSHWPHVVSVGEVTSGPLPRRRFGTSQLDQVQAPSSNRARSLDGREGQRASQTIVSNRTATFAPPRAVLDKLLDTRHIEVREPLSRVDSWERIRQASSGAVPASEAPSDTKPTGAIGSALASASAAWWSASSYIADGAARVFRGRQSTSGGEEAAPASNSSSSSNSSVSSMLPRLSIKISFGNDDENDKNKSAKAAATDAPPARPQTPPPPAPVEPTPVLSPALTKLTHDDNVLPEIEDVDNSTTVAAATTTSAQAVTTPAAAAAAPPSPAAPLPPSALSNWSTTLTSSLATAAETAAGIASVPQRAISDALWPKEVTRMSAESLVQHNNSVLRSHFLQLTITFLAPFESFVLLMVRRGKLTSFSEKEFLEYVRQQRPMREYTARDVAVLDLYQRFCRSVNFHVWLTARLDAAAAQLSASK